MNTKEAGDEALALAKRILLGACPDDQKAKSAVIAVATLLGGILGVFALRGVVPRETKMDLLKILEDTARKLRE